MADSMLYLGSCGMSKKVYKCIKKVAESFFIPKILFNFAPGLKEMTMSNYVYYLETNHGIIFAAGFKSVAECRSACWLAQLDDEPSELKTYLKENNVRCVRLDTRTSKRTYYEV